MSNYKVSKCKDNTFDVVETFSNFVIKNFSKHKDASKLMRHLEKGGGFAGHTPEFFIRTLK